MISTVVNIFNLQVDIQCGSAYEAFENGGVFDLKTRRPLLSRLLPLHLGAPMLTVAGRGIEGGGMSVLWQQGLTA